MIGSAGHTMGEVVVIIVAAVIGFSLGIHDNFRIVSRPHAVRSLTAKYLAIGLLFYTAASPNYILPLKWQSRFVLLQCAASLAASVAYIRMDQADVRQRNSRQVES
jgi:hypothetical protein